MSTLKYPVLVWEDGDGGITAALVEFPEVVAHDATVDDALMQLKALLAWQLENAPWEVETPDFLAAEMFDIKLPLQAEYRVATDLADGWTVSVPPWMGTPRDAAPPTWKTAERRKRERVYPSTRPMKLRLVGVRGRQESGLWACAIPMLGLRFYAHERELLRDLAIHYAREALAKRTPRELTRFLPPRRVLLEHIVVKGLSYRSRGEGPDLDVLNACMSPIGDSGFRRGFMRSHGRAALLDDLRQRLDDGRRSLLLVGPPGVGKTSLLVDAVAAVERKRPDDDGPRVRRRFWMTSAGRLVAGMRYLGQWQERCEEVVAVLEAIKGGLCVERLLDLVRLGGATPADSIAAFLAPYVERGELRMVIEATAEEVDACRRLLPGFVELFHQLAVEPFAAEAEAEILQSAAAALSQQLHVPIADRVADTVARLHRRFMPYAGFPGRPVSFLRGLMSDCRERGVALSEATALDAFSRQSGLPEVFLRDDLALEEDEVRAWFRDQVIGQDDACEAAVRVVMSFKAGLADPERPLAVLLFCGPTGVGKTELARAMGRWFFGPGDGAPNVALGEKNVHPEKDDRIVRLDMSEYAGWGAADRLLGVSGGEPGLLIRRLRQQPFSLVLLDEIEKADAEIFDVLMGVFDEGRLRDAYGRVTTFRSAIVVMTSNLGSEALGGIGLTPRPGPSYEAAAMQFFRPEFFNRLDAVVRFGPLDRDQVRAIAEKELGALNQRTGLQACGHEVRWTEGLLERLVREGYDARYGARPLQRSVEALVVTPLARWLAAHPEARDCTLVVDERGLRDPL